MLGIAECLVLAFSKSGVASLTDEVNRFTRRLKMPKRFFGLSVRILSPSVLAALTVMEAIRLFSSGIAYPLWLQICFGWGLSFLIFAAAAVIYKRATAELPVRKRKKTPHMRGSTVKNS